MRRLVTVVLLVVFAAAFPAAAHGGESSNPNQIVYVLNVQRPTHFHRGSCRRARHRSAVPVRRWWAEDRGAKPCRTCRP